MHDTEIDAFRITGVYVRNPLVTNGFPPQRASNVTWALIFPLSLTKQAVDQTIELWWFEIPWRSNDVTAMVRLTLKMPLDFRRSAMFLVTSFDLKCCTEAPIVEKLRERIQLSIQHGMTTMWSLVVPCRCDNNLWCRGVVIVTAPPPPPCLMYTLKRIYIYIYIYAEFLTIIHVLISYLIGSEAKWLHSAADDIFECILLNEN